VCGTGIHTHNAVSHSPTSFTLKHTNLITGSISTSDWHSVREARMFKRLDRFFRAVETHQARPYTAYVCLSHLISHTMALIGSVGVERSVVQDGESVELADVKGSPYLDDSEVSLTH
jgi:hypothetical protein